MSYQQYVVMAVVACSKPLVSHVTIARKIQRNQNSVTTIVDRTEKQGLLVRTRSKEDRREVYVKLTAKGKKALDKGLKLDLELRLRLGCKFAPEELHDLKRLAVKLGESIREELDKSTLCGEDRS